MYWGRRNKRTVSTIDTTEWCNNVSASLAHVKFLNYKTGYRLDPVGIRERKNVFNTLVLQD